jgi:heme-degrading monooxygenase HmoA
VSAVAGGVQVLIYAAAPPDDPDGVTRAYHRISQDLAGTPGLLGNRLLRSLLDGDRFVVVSEWSDLAAFQAWEQGPDHRTTTAPLRTYQEASRGRSFDVLAVQAGY